MKIQFCLDGRHAEAFEVFARLQSSARRIKDLQYIQFEVIAEMLARFVMIRETLQPTKLTVDAARRRCAAAKNVFKRAVDLPRYHEYQTAFEQLPKTFAPDLARRVFEAGLEHYGATIPVDGLAAILRRIFEAGLQGGTVYTGILTPQDIMRAFDATQQSRQAGELTRSELMRRIFDCGLQHYRAEDQHAALLDKMFPLD